MTRTEKIACGILVLIAAVAVAVCVTTGLETYAREREIEAAYARAEALAQGGEYAGALDALEVLEDSYRNVKSLRYYAHARLSYDLGKLADADSDLLLCDLYMASGEVMPQGYADFRDRVHAEYKAYAQEEMRKVRKAQRERVREEESLAPKASSFPKSSRRQGDGGDPFDAKDYLFPEDFYEDHFDDFYDFYDAEDYYYEHGGS